MSGLWKRWLSPFLRPVTFSSSPPVNRLSPEINDTPTAVFESSSAVVQIKAVNDFRDFFVVASTGPDPDPADDQYFAIAEATWTFNGSGTLGLGIWSAQRGVTGDFVTSKFGKVVDTPEYSGSFANSVALWDAFSWYHGGTF